jgi:hypothetical protein
VKEKVFIRRSKLTLDNYNLTFLSKGCEIRKAGLVRLMAKANKTPSNVYTLNELKGEKCCMGQVNESWFWHRRMGHINFENLVKLNKTKVERDMRVCKLLQ